MISRTRSRVIEETDNFIMVDIDMDDFPDMSSLAMMEIFLADGLLVLHSESYTETEKRGWFSFDRFKSRCRVGCQKIKSDTGRITTTSFV